MAAFPCSAAPAGRRARIERREPKLGALTLLEEPVVLGDAPFVELSVEGSPADQPAKARGLGQFVFSLVGVVEIHFELELVEVMRFDVGLELVLAGLARERLFGGQVLLSAFPACDQFENGKLAVLAVRPMAGEHGTEVPAFGDFRIPSRACSVDTCP